MSGKYFLLIAVLLGISCKVQLLDGLKLGNEILSKQFNKLNYQSDQVDCTVCDPFNCPKLGKCNAGVVRDRCRCCDECAVEEGHLCNLNAKSDASSDTSIWFGDCGHNLECRERTDVDVDLVGRQSICYCTKPGLVCGNDGVSYSLCKMREMETMTDNQTHMISQGACRTQPRIVSIAQSQIVPTNSRISLLCEVEGHPLPTVVWYHVKPGTNSSEAQQRLPGDSEDISVSFRGGPQPMRISSHLQITKFRTENEGKYICMADNDLGIANQELSLVAGPEK